MIFLQAWVGTLWVFLVYGYRLRPDNLHQYWLLSKFSPQDYPPLPWFTQPVHHFFNHFVEFLLYGVGNVPNAFLFLQIIAVWFYVWGIFRLTRVFISKDFVGWVVLGLLLLMHNTAYHPLLDYIKPYLTPTTLAGMAVIWSFVFIFEKKWVRATLCLGLMLLIHKSFLSVFFISLGLVLWQKPQQLKMILLLSVFFVFVWAIDFLSHRHWELFFLDQIRIRSVPLGFWQVYQQPAGLKFLLLMGIVMWMGFRGVLDISRSKLIIFSLLSLLMPLVPRFFHVHRMAPVLEIIAVILIVKFIFSKELKFVKVSLGLLVILCVQIGLQKSKIQRDYFNGLRVMQRSARIPENQKDLIAWIRSNTDPQAVFFISPFMIPFRSVASRLPWVDLAAVPWTLKDRHEWARRLNIVFDQPDHDPHTLYNLPFSEIKNRALKTDANYLVWPCKDLEHTFLDPQWLYRDSIWGVYFLK